MKLRQKYKGSTDQSDGCLRGWEEGSEGEGDERGGEGKRKEGKRIKTHYVHAQVHQQCMYLLCVTILS